MAALDIRARVKNQDKDQWRTNSRCVLRAAITGITYEDGIEGADRVEVTIANQNLKWLDHPLLQVDNGFKLSIGYVPNTPGEEVFVGEITGVEAVIPKQWNA